MPTPKTAKTLAITITSGVKGQPITIRNRTTGDEIHTTLGDTARAVVSLENTPNSYTEGDIIDFKVSGERIGTNTLTLTDKPQSVTIPTSAITSGLTRGI
jgi:hypothetical protein